MIKLREFLKKVKDFRQDSGKRYSLWLVLFLVVLAMMQGNVSYRAIGDFIKYNSNNLRKSLKIEAKRLPSYSTIRRVIRGVDCQELIKIFNEWALLKYGNPQELDWLAIDGKSLRSTVVNYDNKQQNFVMIVSTFSQTTGLVVNREKFENKQDSETRIVQEILKKSQVKGKIFSFDALHCNQKTAQLIRESENEYLLALKKNQMSLYKQVEALTKIEKPLSKNISNDSSHGRKIKRKVSVFANQNIQHKCWPHLKSYIQVERSGNRGEKDYQETAYYLSSTLKDAEIFAEIIRGHWKIENQLHLLKDVIFQEDNMPINEFQAATNFST